jgi:hypothetical protein
MSKPTITAWYRALGKAREYNARAETIRAELAKTCEHPSSVVTDFTWEHDNGYGRQSMVTGQRCTVCRAEKRWKNHGSWTTEEQRRAYRSDYDY